MLVGGGGGTTSTHWIVVLTPVDAIKMPVIANPDIVPSESFDAVMIVDL